MHEISPLLRYLGLRPTGDLGPLTIYTNKRGRMTSFPKSPPLKPASKLQRAQRAKFAAIAVLWQSLTKEARFEWEAAAADAGCYCTGFNLFVFYEITRDRATIRTIERQTGRVLLPN